MAKAGHTHSTYHDLLHFNTLSSCCISLIKPIQGAMTLKDLWILTPNSRFLQRWVSVGGLAGTLLLCATFLRQMKVETN